MIIGHSLGGGLAKIISLVTEIQAVALSGSGVRFIGHFYQNKTVINVKDTIVDVIPGQDLIARVYMPIGSLKDQLSKGPLERNHGENII